MTGIFGHLQRARAHSAPVAASLMALVVSLPACAGVHEFGLASPADAAAVTPSPVATVASVWCGRGKDFAAGGPLDPGVSALCTGHAEAAVEALLRSQPDVGGGTNYGKFQRLRWIVFAALAAHRDDVAQSALSKADPGWKAGPEERAFFSGDYARSYQLHVAQDASYPRDPDHQDAHKLDSHLPAALAKLRAGDLAGAAAEDARSQSEGSLYSLMSGDLHAADRDWSGAYAKWVEASMIWTNEETFAAGGIGWPVEPWNVTALHMMYYYREHAPDRR